MTFLLLQSFLLLIYYFTIRASDTCTGDIEETKTRLRELEIIIEEREKEDMKREYENSNKTCLYC